MKNHGLQFKKKVTRESKSFYFIEPSDFWKWALQHKEKVQFLAIEEQVLLQNLLGLKWREKMSENINLLKREAIIIGRFKKIGS